MDSPHRVERENLRFAPGHVQTVADVLLGLGLGQRLDVIVHGDALPHGFVPLFEKRAVELRLAHEKDVDQLAVFKFDVGEQADLFEQIVMKALGLVDDQQHFFIGGMRREQKFLEVDQEVALGGEPPVHFELFGQDVEKIGRIQARVWNRGHDG